MVFETMSETERQSWITLIADSIVLAWFWKAMAPGWSLIPTVTEPEAVGRVFLSVVVLTIVTHAVIAAVFNLRRGKDDIELDERDRDAQGYGSHVGYLAMYFGVGATMLALLSGYVFPEDVGGPFKIMTVVHALFVLVILSYLADLARNVAMILRYRSI